MSFSHFSHDASGHDAGYSHDASVYIHHGQHYGTGGESGWGAHAGHHHGDHFDSNSYANAFGGHTHHHHGGILASLFGGHHQGGLLAQLLGLNQTGMHHGGILSQLFGLDSKHVGSHGLTQAQGAQVQQGALTWGNIGRAFKHDLFDDFQATPAFLFLCLIGGMVIWLFVVSFTREHETSVNKILGANSAQVAAYENEQHLRDAAKITGPVQDAAFRFGIPESKFNSDRMAVKGTAGYATTELNTPPAAAIGAPGLSAPPAPVLFGTAGFSSPTAPVLNTPAFLPRQGVSSIVAPGPKSLDGTSIRTVNGRVQTVVDR